MVEEIFDNASDGEFGQRMTDGTNLTREVQVLSLYQKCLRKISSKGPSREFCSEGTTNFLTKGLRAERRISIYRFR